ncbi:hypothetical protein ACIGFK_41550 [Streptomyces sp. NPDC085524]|uniref:hypothetical protein n=1 Tax=Streptomyces sp. NPDC085524 TaxID=3365728 RepID=UPI0037CDCA7C
MSGRRAWVGDHVEDGNGYGAIVTDVRGGTTWVLRPVYGGTAHQWEVDDPDTLTVIRPRVDRIRDDL